MRILHFADVHLDRPFVGLPAGVAIRRRHELFEAFRRCLATAKERDAELITIGGDLWEEEHVTADTRKSVCYELAQVGLPVLIACGNHDPLIAGGSYLRTEWPDNVTVMPRRTISDHSFGDVCIWSVSWGGGDHLSPLLLERLEAPEDGRTHVLLIHDRRPQSGMFSFFPARRATDAAAGFLRPVIALPEIVTSTMSQGKRLNPQPDLDAVVELWHRIVASVRAQEVELGVRATEPTPAGATDGGPFVPTGRC